MKCRLLGPLEFWADGDWAGVSAPKLRALLATLLLRRGQVVPAGLLVDELWGDDPPPAARKLVSGYVLRLRRLTGDPDGRVLVTSAPGYRLLVARGDVDVSRFEEMVTAAREALEGADGAQAAGLLDRALRLWRGPALADVPAGPLVAAEVARLEELRLDAAELRVEARICCGRGADLVAELRHLTAGYPLRERFWHQLMRALESSGRPAEALEAYGQARAVLADELGTDPGPGLQQLHRRLLAGGATSGSLPTGGSGRTSAAGLRQLPGTVKQFAGRAAELAMLTGLPRRSRTGLPGTMVISAVNGMPGVGKTALAVQAGHLLAGWFPDGQLFVDLHGHTPGQEPASPADVLAGLLAADGVDPRYLPAGLDGRAAMWRDRIAGQRVLLILDNAASSSQVAPLLPGTAGCLVLVTSRRFLGDLPAAVEVSLDVLPAGDAVAMFTGLAPRAAAEPARVAELVTLCGHLPLAISLLARLLTRHRSWGMADLIGEAQARLLTATAENQTVTAAFELSYQDLNAGQQRLFRHLGLHPGADIDAYAAAALAGLPLEEAAEYLDGLHGCRLLEEPVPRRYRMHDLIRQYARALAPDAAGGERELAIGRLFSYYQHTAEAADGRLARHPRTPATTPVPAPAATPGLPDQSHALAWMTAERANLVACISHAAARADQARVAGLTAAIAARLRSDGPWPQAAALHTAAAQAAQHTGDQPGHANALINLGDMLQLTGDYPGAIRLLEQARDIYRGTGSRLGEANALFYLGDARRLTGDYPGAADLLAAALDTYRSIGSRLGEANALRNLGTVQEMAGDYPAATRVLEEALTIFRGIGCQIGEAEALLYLGAIREETGDYPAAIGVLEQARDISRGISYRLGEANALLYLGDVRQVTGDYPAATGVLEQARDIYRGIGSRLGEANALLYLGTVRQLTGDYLAAVGLLEQARDIYRDLGSRLGEANALLHLGDVRQVTGDYLAAVGLLEQARDIYRDLGSRLGEANALCCLGGASRMTGDYLAAVGLLEQARDIYRGVGDRHGESVTLIETGAMHLTRGDPKQARAHYQRAMQLARTIGSQLEEARALEGIGKCATAIHAADADRKTLRQALEIYQRIGSADARRLAAEIDIPH